jgi:D-alanyl-D-alanine dipeptidase
MPELPVYCRFYRRRMCILVAVVGCSWSALVSAAMQISPATDAAQAGMLDVAQLAPSIDVDMRYAGSNNFTGRRVPGYEVGRCLLLQPAAEALARVQQQLRADGYSLRLYDCYRPAHAVAAFVAWARDLDDQRSKPSYYPNLDKRVLLGDYIAETSGHSRGATVDLGLLDCRSGQCQLLDMGTDFDFFDERANTDTLKITTLQRRNRQLLLQAMAKQGFVNYPLEWWHFSFRPEPAAATAYDFPIR